MINPLRHTNAAQIGINHSTVERAADFTSAVDTIVRVTGFT